MKGVESAGRNVEGDVKIMEVRLARDILTAAGTSSSLQTRRRQSAI